MQEQMAVTGGYGDKKLNQKQIKRFKKRKERFYIVWMNDRWVYKEIQPYIIKQMLVLVGILIGTLVSLVNLQNIKKASIMIGIVIAGINLINDNKVIHHMVKLENYL